MTIRKATEQYFSGILFITPYKMVQTLESVTDILNGVIIQMKVSEKYFPVVLLVSRYYTKQVQIILLASLDHELNDDLGQKSKSLPQVRVFLFRTVVRQQLKNHDNAISLSFVLLTYTLRQAPRTSWSRLESTFAKTSSYDVSGITCLSAM